MLSRLVVSRNDKQNPNNQYSYTAYDTIGRITEVGQKTQTTLNITTPHYLPADTLTMFYTAGIDSQVTDTYYDTPVPTVSGNSNGIATVNQNNLRKRVAASTYSDSPGLVTNATYYSYDLDGNVETLWQQVNGLYIPSTNAGLKRIDYEYDLISGKVNFVRYQDGQPDAFYYSYSYDADNRLTYAWSGTQALVDTLLHSVLLPGNGKLDAHYAYYLHGPLARMELGDTTGRVQGVDYAYTLQGWLKGVNDSRVQSATDMGRDSLHVARDAYGYSLYYYANTSYPADYTPISGNNPFDTTPADLATFKPLYNGNIAAMSTNITQLSNPWHYYTYQYDQLNRIRQTNTYKVSSPTVNTPVTDYHESFTYDGNGNIKTANRYAGAGVVMDSTQYQYNYTGGRLTNNRLNYIADAITTHTYPYGLDNQAVNNYTYDAIGNMTADVIDTISNITWNVYGKIQGLTNSGGAITYSYDPGGQRVTQTAAGVTTYYIRDAQGNTLALYDNTHSTVNWKEQDLYGSSRLGLWLPNIALSTGNSVATSDTTGKKRFELPNHLQNVLATITDKRLQHTTNGTSVDYFNADISTAQEYYAFGGLMANRNYTFSKNYRYGFNGKENDNDVKGTGNQQDYGMRIYDPRVGKFLSVDPIAASYAYYTPYQYTGNSPIAFNDLDGAERIYYIYEFSGNKGSAMYKKTIVQTHEPGIFNTLRDVLSHPTTSFVPYARRANDYNGDLIVGIQKIYVIQGSDFSQEYNSLGELQKVSQKDFLQSERANYDQQVDLTYINEQNQEANNQPTHVDNASRDNQEEDENEIENGIVYAHDISIKTEDILFSQQSVNDLTEIVVSMKKSGWQGPPIDVVDLGNGKYGTLDNTRVLAAHEAGINVKANIHKSDDLLNEANIRKFTTKKGGIPKTWGDAYRNRIGKQNSAYRKANPNGSYSTRGNN